MIPLSLYVTIEMAKLVQVYHIHNDVDLYDPETNKRVECRALNVSEELGQVRVFPISRSLYSVRFHFPVNKKEFFSLFH
jgi:hypothetical protein